MPTTAFVNIKSPRYRADSIIKIQNRNCPDSLDFVLGLTTKDVSVTKKDKNGNIWIAHGYKGIFKIKLNKTFGG